MNVPDTGGIGRKEKVSSPPQLLVRVERRETKRISYIPGYFLLQQRVCIGDHGGEERTRA